MQVPYACMDIDGHGLLCSKLCFVCFFARSFRKEGGGRRKELCFVCFFARSLRKKEGGRKEEGRRRKEEGEEQGERIWVPCLITVMMRMQKQ